MSDPVLIFFGSFVNEVQGWQMLGGGLKFLDELNLASLLNIKLLIVVALALYNSCCFMIDPLSVGELVEEALESLKNEPNLEMRTLHINDYIDRQLRHLVVTQQFDFSQIAYLLGMMFPEYKTRLGKRYCEERWTQLHLVRKHKLDQKLKQNRKLMAVMAFEDPKKFLTARELIKELQIEEEKRVGQHFKQQLKNQPKGQSFNQMLQNLDKPKFDITKDRVKRISPERYKAMEEEYLSALEKAKQVSDDMCDKPYVYRPKFIVDNKYELQRQDLTEQKAKEIVSSDIMLDSKVVGGFDEFKDENFQSRFKKQAEKSYQPRSKGIFGHIIQDKWSDYESDEDT